MAACTHKFVHRDQKSYYQSNSRFSWKYVQVDYYFCEKCLEEKEQKKEIILDDSEIDKKPDWAKTITTRVKGYND